MGKKLENRVTIVEVQKLSSFIARQDMLSQLTKTCAQNERQLIIFIREMYCLGCGLGYSTVVVDQGQPAVCCIPQLRPGVQLQLLGKDCMRPLKCLQLSFKLTKCHSMTILHAVIVSA